MKYLIALLLCIGLCGCVESNAKQKDIEKPYNWDYHYGYANGYKDGLEWAENNGWERKK